MSDRASSIIKRRRISTPFTKPENRSWSSAKPTSLTRSISPPPATLRRQKTLPLALNEDVKRAIPDALPNTAEVEAGEVKITDHLSFWSSKLSAFTRPTQPDRPQLNIERWIDLYKSHAASQQGCHFVIHQHDHPVAGIHYDLRLQCNATSSISFAIMYGLPGDPNSRRLNRNATETRVHCLWNHLIETASLSTGSMLIWDTGSYEVLPYKEDEPSPETDDEEDSESYHSPKSQPDGETEQEKLHAAFRSRKIRLRLHGTKLPQEYTISLRLTKDNYRSEQPDPPSRKRKRELPKSMKKKKKKSPQTTDEDSFSESESYNNNDDNGNALKHLTSLLRHETPPLQNVKGTRNLLVTTKTATPDLGGSDIEDETVEDQEEIRKSNAYPGATNDIGSIHQRKWYLSMDRKASGYLQIRHRSREGRRVTWVRKQEGEDNNNSNVIVATAPERFHVLGREVERSVVTGRLGREIFDDEGVVGFMPRGLWRPVTK